MTATTVSGYTSGKFGLTNNNLHIQYEFTGSNRQGVRVVMELRLGLFLSRNPQWRCLVGSNPTLVNILVSFGPLDTDLRLIIGWLAVDVLDFCFLPT